MTHPTDDDLIRRGDAIAALNSVALTYGATWEPHSVRLCKDALREIRAQPHDRSALDRMLAETRENALREAASEAERTGTCLLPSGHFLSERCRDAILALIGTTQ